MKAVAENPPPIRHKKKAVTPTQNGKRGRPSVYSQELADAICMRLARGESLRSICRDGGMPDPSTVLAWAHRDAHPFSQQYARAREIGYSLMAEEIIVIADGGKLAEDQPGEAGQSPSDKDDDSHLNHDVNRDRLRVDTRKWILARMLPKIYSDKLRHTGDDTNPIRIAITWASDKSE